MNKTFRALAALLALLCLLTACSNGNWRNDLTSAAVMDTVTAAVTTADGYTPVADGYINASMWGDDYQTLLDTLTDHRILISARSDMNIDEIGVLHVTADDRVADAARIVEEYVKAQTLRHKNLLESYNPDELPKTENGKVTVCGSYILYTILGDSETAAAHEAFEGALRVSE